MEQELRRRIKEVSKIIKETKEKVRKDAEIEGVDLFPHFVTIAMFSGMRDGLNLALRIVKKGNK